MLSIPGATQWKMNELVNRWFDFPLCLCTALWSTRLVFRTLQPPQNVYKLLTIEPASRREGERERCHCWIAFQWDKIRIIYYVLLSIFFTKIKMAKSPFTTTEANNNNNKQQMALILRLLIEWRIQTNAKRCVSAANQPDSLLLPESTICWIIFSGGKRRRAHDSKPITIKFPLNVHCFLLWRVCMCILFRPFVEVSTCISHHQTRAPSTAATPLCLCIYNNRWRGRFSFFSISTFYLFVCLRMRLCVRPSQFNMITIRVPPSLLIRKVNEQNIVVACRPSILKCIPKRPPGCVATTIPSNHSFNGE